MAGLTEEEVYELAVYLIEITDAVIGGSNGIANMQAKQLANRTAWLKANKQDKDATLTAIAALTTAEDKLIYATGADTFSLTTLSVFARTLLDDVDAATMRATIGAQAAGSYQASDATLSALAALTTAADKLIYATGADTFSLTTLSTFARTLLDDNNGATMFATLGAIQSLASNGYTKLPNGLLLQWGTITSSGTGGNNAAISFPISFPNATLGVYTTTNMASGNYNAQFINATVNAANITAYLGAVITSGVVVKWYAIGY